MKKIISGFIIALLSGLLACELLDDLGDEYIDWCDDKKVEYCLICLDSCLDLPPAEVAQCEADCESLCYLYLYKGCFFW